MCTLLVYYSKGMTMKRYKNFKQQIWNEELSKKDWSQIEKADDVNEMVGTYTALTTEAL